MKKNEDYQHYIFTYSSMFTPHHSDHLLLAGHATVFSQWTVRNMFMRWFSSSLVYYYSDCGCLRFYIIQPGSLNDCVE